MENTDFTQPALGPGLISALPAGRTVALEVFLRWNHPVRGQLQPASFLDLADDLTVFATRNADGRATPIFRGELVPALLASMAISGVFPAVTIDGQEFSDGGTTNNLPCSTAKNATCWKWSASSSADSLVISTAHEGC